MSNCKHTTLQGWKGRTFVLIGGRTESVYPGCEVHSSSSVQQQGGDIHVTIVSRNVQRGESTLFETKRREGEEKWWGEEHIVWNSKVWKGGWERKKERINLQQQYCNEATCWWKETRNQQNSKMSQAINNACNYPVRLPCVVQIKNGGGKKIIVWVFNIKKSENTKQLCTMCICLDRQMDIYINYMSYIMYKFLQLSGGQSLPFHSDRHGAI